MFFLLSKTLDLALDPLWWALGPLSLGVLLLARGKRRRLALGLCAWGFVVLLLACLPAVADRLEAGLEAEAPNTMQSDVTYDVVVLLGGVVNPSGSLPGAPALNDNVERLTVTRTLLATDRARVAILSGGEYGVAGLPTEAEYLAQQLVEWGVPRERLILEDKAKNTRENAVFVKALVEQKGFKSVLVVTSAFHMPRAAGCFRAAGLQADFLPVDYRMLDPSRDSHVLPRGDYLHTTSAVVRERVGALVYWVLGYAK
jgi:uncharacterized SAM-binding protein YcdF (DUF218 family)